MPMSDMPTHSRKTTRFPNGFPSPLPSPIGVILKVTPKKIRFLLQSLRSNSAFLIREVRNEKADDCIESSVIAVVDRLRSRNKRCSRGLRVLWIRTLEHQAVRVWRTWASVVKCFLKELVL